MPTGSYRAGWNFNDATTALPNPITVGEDGFTFGVIDITPAATPNGTVLFGTAVFANGTIPRADIGAHDIHLRATVTATSTGGLTRQLKPDWRGRWIFHNIPRAAYPVTLKATFATLDSTPIVLNTPPATNNPISLTFPQVLPKVSRVRAFQEGKAVLRLKPGPVTLEASINNPAGLPLQPRWAASARRRNRTT